MPILNNNTILFIHIPKTAGTSIEHHIGTNGAKCYGYSHLYKIKNISKIMLSHLTYLQIKNLFDLSSIKLMFSVVRDPYDRIGSAIGWNSFYDYKDMNKDKYTQSLKKFIDTDPLSIDNHNLCQFEFLKNELNVINPLIKIIYFENLKRDMSNIGFYNFNSHIISGNKKIEYRKNVYKDILNKESISIINQIYEQDFLSFNYSFL